MTQSAIISKKHGISAIWLVPIVALLAGAYIFYQYYTNQGEEIYIRMPYAEGVAIDKTEIRVRSVKIGVIKGLRLSEDLKSVLATAEISPTYNHLLRKDSQIWSVKPTVDETGISGLSTLLSGIYFELLPGKSKDLTNQFTLLDEPPHIQADVAGGRYKLKSESVERLDVGSGVYYRGYRIGQVESAVFDWRNKQMNYQVFVTAPYNSLVADNSLFWLRSGFEVELSANGLSVKSKDMSSILRGGIALGFRNDEVPGKEVAALTQFPLFSNEKTALERQFTDSEAYLIHFEQSVRGLVPGAPVEYRGVRVGTVLEVPANLENIDRTSYFNVDNKNLAIPVLIKIEYQRLNQDAVEARKNWHVRLPQWVKSGLRASLKSGNLLTGALFVDLDFYRKDKPAQIATSSGYPTIPAVNGGIDQILVKINKLLDKLNEVPVEKSLAQLDQTVAAFEVLAQDTRALLASDEVKSVPVELAATLKHLQQTLGSFDQEAPAYKDLQRTLKSIDAMVIELNGFTENLKANPSQLIFDKNNPQDIEPRKTVVPDAPN